MRGLMIFENGDLDLHFQRSLDMTLLLSASVATFWSNFGYNRLYSVRGLMIFVNGDLDIHFQCQLM